MATMVEANKGSAVEGHAPHGIQSKPDLMKLYEKEGKVCKSREETQRVVEKLLAGAVAPPPISNVHGTGPLLLSDVPPACSLDNQNKAHGSVVVGIDEAGRGSVLGPMIYGMAYWHESDEATIPRDFNDSKQLSDDTRRKLFQKILQSSRIGFGVRVLPATEISRSMLRPEPCNLNQMSHGAAMQLIQSLLDAQVPVHTCYIDTVGVAEHYQRKLERVFPNISFVVESKADAKYAPCSAASVVAKVTRDCLMEHHVFSEKYLAGDTMPRRDWGSGYPSDPTCKKWLEQQIACPVFGYSDVVRFSWNPIKKLLQQNAESKRVATVEFAADADNDENTDEAHKIGVKRQRQQMASFLSGQPGAKKRYPYFERLKLRAVTKIG